MLPFQQENLLGAAFDLEGNLAQLQRGKNTKLSWKPGFVLDEIWAFLPPPRAQTPGLPGSVLSASVGHGGDVAFGLAGLGAATMGETLQRADFGDVPGRWRPCGEGFESFVLLTVKFRCLQRCREVPLGNRAESFHLFFFFFSLLLLLEN